jgi:hypothetical protein
VIVVMPAGEVFDPVFGMVSKVAGTLGAERVDPGSDLKARIQTGEELVFDVSARHPLVLFWLGYAVALGKKVICISQHEDDLIRTAGKGIVYAHDLEFLGEKLRQALKGNEKRADSQEQNDSQSPYDQFMSKFGQILKEHGHEHRGRISMESEKVFVLHEQDMELALVQHLAREARRLGLRIKFL